jgi:hypothetical protein
VEFDVVNNSLKTMLGAHAEALEPHVTICIGSWTTEDLNKVDDLYAPLLRLCVDLGNMHAKPRQAAIEAREALEKTSFAE